MRLQGIGYGLIPVDPWRQRKVRGRGTDGPPIITPRRLISDCL